MKHFVDLASLRLWILSSLMTIQCLSVSSQDIAIGTWRTHFSYKSAKKLVKTSDKVFCATENGLFSREISSGATRKLSKIDGLSDVGVTTMNYNQEQNLLVIGYASGFVDFIFENEIRTIVDLANSNLDINKTINDITFGPNETYLATDIGVLVINTVSTEVKENFVQIGNGGDQVEVLQILYSNETLFLRTSEGIQSGSLSQNLLDFDNWNRYSGSDEFTNLTSINNEFYVTSGSNLLQLQTDWVDTEIDLPDGASKLFDVDNELYTADTDGDVYRLSDSGFELVTSTSNVSVNDIEVTAQGFLFADGDKGLVDETGSLLSPDGPVSDLFSNFRVVNGEVYGFHAPSPFFYNGNTQQDEFSVFSEGIWKGRVLSNFNNVSDVVRFNNTLYYSSIGDGLYNEETDEIIINIPGSIAEPDTMITALASGDRLWISSFRNNEPIHSFDGNEWTAYPRAVLFDDEFLTIDLSQNEIAWLGSSAGTITVIDPSQNETDLISGNDGLPSSFIDIDISIEDNAWVATSGGPALFPDASFIFFSSEAIRPTFENRILFEGEEINGVMTDGGNRIWFGTNSGIWVYDENTSELAAVFNERNSPLPSNRIIQLAYNGINGEVFIYTDKGMVSFRSSSSIGTRNHQNVNIFPNPVRPNYTGLVGLSGLARNVSVKVTDLNGNLVTELEANGGSASWDLLDGNGGQISTGIYLFFSSTSDGEETYVGKIAVIR